MNLDAIVVGAGIAGLSCARTLQQAGLRVVVVDRARGVGGRCATRRILDEQPVDHGVAFLHGGDASFLAALDAVDAPRLEGWPYRVEGRGVPCQPDTYTARDRRLAFVSGVSAFPKHLARGLDVRKGVGVSRIDHGGVTLEDGNTLTAPRVVLALALEQVRALLPVIPETVAARTLLDWLGTVPCLALIAVYPPSVPTPDFDIAYPEDGPLQVVSHDSSKRVDAAHRVLVLAAGATPSREWLADAPERWAPRLLTAAAERYGGWIAEPRLTQAHRWRYARFTTGTGLGGPLLVSLPRGATLGLAGEAFGPLGGVQGAFVSGEALARRILGG